MQRSLVLLGLLTMATGSVPAGAADVRVVSSFEGNKGPGWKAAANVMGAVGPSHVVDFTVGGFTVHDKATGKVRRHLSQHEFWNQVEPAGSIDPQKDANDPWMVYDPLSQRWFATTAGTSPGVPFLAVSVSSGPTQAWKGIELPLPRIDPGMKIGVDIERTILVTVAVVSGIVAFDLAGQSGTLSAGASQTFAQEGETQTKTGVVRSVDAAGKKIVVMVARELTFTVTEKTKIRRGDDAKTLDDIKVGGKVAVEYTREGETRTAKTIAILAEEEKTSEKLEGVQTKEGEVKKVDVAGNKLVVMVARELTFTVTESTKIRQGSDVKKLADVKVGDRVKVTYNRTGDNRVATSVAIRQAEKKD